MWQSHVPGGATSFGGIIGKVIQGVTRSGDFDKMTFRWRDIKYNSRHPIHVLPAAS
jgi:hypothetical protein